MGSHPCSIRGFRGSPVGEERIDFQDSLDC